jgi:hypothetical protein
MRDEARQQMTLSAGEAVRTITPAASRRRRTGLWSMAYISRLTADMGDDELVTLTVQAQRRNLSLDVTGVLFMSDDRVLQILEGDRRALSWLFPRINADPRHRHVIRVLDCPIDQRVFEGWSMRLMNEQDLGLDWRRIVLDSLDHAERLDEIGGRLKVVEFAHCYAALGAASPRPQMRPV